MISGIDRWFAEFSSNAAILSSRPLTFIVVVAYVVGWVVLGPFFGFSDAWQLSMNTTGSIVVLLMVFLIQNTQVRDTEAIHAKLDALLHAIENAGRRYIALEEMTHQEIQQFRDQHGPYPKRRRPSVEA